MYFTYDDDPFDGLWLDLVDLHWPFLIYDYVIDVGCMDSCICVSWIYVGDMLIYFYDSCRCGCNVDYWCENVND